MFLAVIITIFLSMASILLKKSKFLTLLFFAFTWLLFGWNHWNGDYEAYEKLYDFPQIEVILSGHEFGYNALMYLFNYLGFTFQEFFIVISFISLVLLFNFIIRYANYPAFFAVVFFLCFFPLDYVLLRNFLAFTIVLQGLILVINRHKYAKVLFVLTVLLAFLFHGTALFYLILVFCFGEKRINPVYVPILVFIALILYITVGNSVMNLIFESSGRVSLYESSIITFIINSFIQIVNFIIMRYFYIKSLKQPPLFEGQNRFNTILININLILLFVMPLYLNYAIAVRLLWNISLVNVILMINTYMQCKSKRDRTNLFIIFILYIAFFFMYMIIPYIDFTLFALYKYNLIFK